MNVPKLRFKEFNGEWIQKKIKDVANVIGGGTPSTDELKYWGNEINWFIPSEIGKTKYVSSSQRKITLNGLNNSSAKLLPKGTILLSSRATVGEASILLEEASTNQGFQSLVVKKTHNNEFIYYLKEKYKKEMLIKAFGSTFLEISKSNVENIDIIIPTLNEQTKIANFLSLLDKKIELQTKKIEDLKLFKKGLLNFFFENKKTNGTIENCILYGKAGGTPASNIKDYYDGNIPFLSISDMTSQRKYILKTEKSISQQGIRDSSAWIVPKNSIILSMYASYGLIAINKIELATSQAMFSMIVNSKNNIEYIYYYLEFLYNNNYYDRLVSIGTQANLNADKVKKIKIYLLDINSQNKISKILKLCDERIEYENKIEFELSKFKQGLMQNMFV